MRANKDSENSLTLNGYFEADCAKNKAQEAKCMQSQELIKHGAHANCA